MEEDPKEVWAYVFISTSQPRRVVQAVREIPGGPTTAVQGRRRSHPATRTPVSQLVHVLVQVVMKTLLAPSLETRGASRWRVTPSERGSRERVGHRGASPHRPPQGIEGRVVS